MYSEPEFQALKDAAIELGREHGQAEASWLFDGNTTRETYQRFATWVNEGDPELWNHWHAPLSGEYADDWTPGRLMAELGATPDPESEEESELCQAYEDAHSSAWHDFVDAATHRNLADE